METMIVQRILKFLKLLFGSSNESCLFVFWKEVSCRNDLRCWWDDLRRAIPHRLYTPSSTRFTRRFRNRHLFLFLNAINLYHRPHLSTVSRRHTMLLEAPRALLYSTQERAWKDLRSYHAPSRSLLLWQHRNHLSQVCGCSSGGSKVVILRRYQHGIHAWYVLELSMSKNLSLFRFRYKGRSRQSLIRPHMNRTLNDLASVRRPIKKSDSSIDHL